MARTGTDAHEQGRKNRAEGKAFEARIDKAFAYYKAKGYAQVDKTPEPVRILQRMEGGHFKACYDKKAQPDYKGTIKGGRSVLFEAKHTTTDRMADSKVTQAQWDYLTQAAALGAHCYVLAGFAGGNVYKVPWEIWSAMKDFFGRKYVTEKDLTQYQVKTGWSGQLMIF